MKKTIITLFAMAGLCSAVAADIAEFDFKSDDLNGSSELTSITLEDLLTSYTATITVAKGYTLTGGSWTEKTGVGSDYIAASSKNMDATLTLTFGGLTAGNKYDVSVVTGVPFEGAGSWNTMNLSNTYASTDLPIATQNIQVRDITTYNVKEVVASDSGTITFSIAKSSSAHTASFNYASITASVPEPATATLSLLALAGLAARRRRK